jgi:hypothetical protein
MVTSLQKLLTLGLLACQLPAFSQSTPGIVREQWSSNNTVQNLDSKFSKESAVILLDKRRVEYVDEKEEVASYKKFTCR